jgi:hypothetical protein
MGDEPAGKQRADTKRISMMEHDDPAGSIFDAWLPFFEDLAARLATEPWWRDGWVSRAGRFEEGIYFQLYKPGWHNENLMGVHLETWVTVDGMTTMSLPVVLHVEPRTPERGHFNALLVARAAALMMGWPGRLVPIEDDPTERYVVRLPLSLPDLSDRLIAEFRRMSEVGEMVDTTLRSLVDHRA